MADSILSVIPRGSSGIHNGGDKYNHIAVLQSNNFIFFIYC